MKMKLQAETALITPLPVERDEYGCWTHPEYEKFCDGREVIPESEFDDWLSTHGLTMQVVFRNDSPDGGSDEGDFSGWEPEKPEGDGWFVGYIHDTESDGVCIWLRHREEVDLHALRQLTENTTPGKWYCEDDDWSDGDNAIIMCDLRNGMVPIATIGSGGSAPDSTPTFAAEQRANARFIAAFNPTVARAVLDELAYYKSRLGITPDAIDTAMFSCVEGYAMSVINSLEFELERKLTDDEQQAVYRHVENVVAVAARCTSFQETDHE